MTAPAAADAPDVVPEAGSAGGVVFDAPSVLRIVWADPRYTAEHVAGWSLEHYGPRAGRAVAGIRSKHPDADRDELERLVIERQTRVAMTEGAFVGGPFIVLIAVAYCAALLAQAKMIFELAAVAGLDPTDELRAADLLVLFEAYGSTDEAQAALLSMARHPHDRQGKKLPRGTRWETIKRMGYLLEVFGGSDPNRTRLRAALGWAGVGLVFVVGLALPLVWVPYMAIWNRRITIRRGNRTRAYYAEGQGVEAGGTVQEPPSSIQVGGLAALLRVLLVALLPIAVALVAWLAGASFGTGRFLDALLLVLAASALGTLAWLAYHRRRLRRSATEPENG